MSIGDALQEPYLLTPMFFRVTFMWPPIIRTKLCDVVFERPAQKSCNHFISEEDLNRVPNSFNLRHLQAETGNTHY